MGNGPSLKDIMNNPKYLKILKENDTFGLNAAYRVYDKYNFYPTYFGCFDYVVNESHKKEFENLVLSNNTIKKFYFIGDSNLKQNLFRDEVKNNNRFVLFNFIHVAVNKYNKLSSNFKKYYNPGSSGANAAQIGIMLGYKKIILLGCDCNYVEKINEAEHYDKNNKNRITITKEVDNNPNYWFDSYQQIGDNYNLPSTNNIQIGSWKNIYNYCPNNVKIYNFSQISKIPYFKKFTMDNLPDLFVKCTNNTINIKNIIENNKITQVHNSKGTCTGPNGFPEYKYNNCNTLFWGMYRDEDVKLCINHMGNKWIYWHDNDCNPEYINRRSNMKKILKSKNIIHLCNDKTSKYLDYFKLDYDII